MLTPDLRSTQQPAHAILLLKRAEEKVYIKPARFEYSLDPNAEENSKLFCKTDTEGVLAWGCLSVGNGVLRVLTQTAPIPELTPTALLD